MESCGSKTADFGKKKLLQETVPLQFLQIHEAIASGAGIVIVAMSDSAWASGRIHFWSKVIYLKMPTNWWGR